MTHTTEPTLGEVLDAYQATRDTDKETAVRHHLNDCPHCRDWGKWERHEDHANRKDGSKDE